MSETETDATVTLLVVEDETLLLHELKIALEDAGFQVRDASNGRDSMAAIETENEAIKALITDVNLGNSPSGWDLGHAARERNPGLPVIYVSGGAESDWAVKGVPKSVFIAKPHAAVQVVVAVSSLMNADGDTAA